MEIVKLKLRHGLLVLAVLSLVGLLAYFLLPHSRFIVLAVLFLFSIFFLASGLSGFRKLLQTAHDAQREEVRRSYYESGRASTPGNTRKTAMKKDQKLADLYKRQNKIVDEPDLDEDIIGDGDAILRGNKPHGPLRTLPEELLFFGFGSIPSESELRKAYRKRAKKAHPDRGGDPMVFDHLNKTFEKALAFVKNANHYTD